MKISEHVIATPSFQLSKGDEEFRARVQHHAPSPTVEALLWLLLAFGIYLLVTSDTPYPDSSLALSLGVAGVLLGVPGVLTVRGVAWSLRRDGQWKQAEVTDEGVFLDGHLVAPVSAILSVGRERLIGGRVCTSVVLRSRALCEPRVVLTMEDEQTANAFLVSLRVGDGNTLHFMRPTRIAAVAVLTTLVCLGGCCQQQVMIPVWAIVLSAWLFGLVMMAWFSRCAITFGADGVHISSPMHKEHFSFEDLDWASWQLGAVVFRLRASRRAVVVALDAPYRIHDSPSWSGRAVADMINTRSCASRAGTYSVDPRFLLSLLREHSSVSDWIRSLRSKAKISAGYRNNDVPGVVVANVLEATAVPAQVRGAAAVALYAIEGETATAQILRVSTTTANPKLRVLLEKIVRGADDDVLARELDALAPEGAKN